MQRIFYLWRSASVVQRLIYITMSTSFIVWALGYVLMEMDVLYRPLANYFGSYPGGYLLARQPWGIVTYPWIHRDLVHLVINMLMLYMLGGMYERRYGAERMVTLYLLGALAGGLFYSFGYQLLTLLRYYLPSLPLLGGSAGIYTLAFAVAFAEPHRTVESLFLGRVRIVWLVLTLFLLDMVLKGDNIGGQLAHIGGAVLGIVWGYRIRVSSVDITSAFRRFIRGCIPSRWSRRTRHNVSVSDINRILDKIRQSGYSSLSSSERRKLHRYSNNIPNNP